MELFMVGFVESLLFGLVLYLLWTSARTFSVLPMSFIVLLAFVSGIIYASSVIPLNIFDVGFWMYTVFQFFMHISIMVVTTDSDEGEIHVGYLLLVVGMILWFFVAVVASSVQEIQFKKYDPFLNQDPQKIILVPKDTAIALAENELRSEFGSLGVDRNHITLQKVKGRVVWVVPLYNKRCGNIPGFILVDPYNVKKKPQLINREMKHSLGIYFEELVLDDVTAIMDNFMFVVDDDLNPYLIATILKANREPVGVKLLNLQTGKIRFYSIDEIPRWVEIVFPESVVSKRISAKGSYHWKLTDGGGRHSMFLVDDGVNTYWVSGVVPVEQCQGQYNSCQGQYNYIIALVAVNTRTGEAFWVDARMLSQKDVVYIINSHLSKLNWEVTTPRLYKVNGKFIWFTIIIDIKTRYPVKYAIVDAEDPSHYVIKSSFKKAWESFFEKNIKN